MANGFNTLPANIPGNPSPFALHISEEALAEFNQLLRLSPIGPKTWWNQDTTGKFGVSCEWLTEAKETWLSTKFNWRTHEDYINSFPNFKIPIIDPEAGTVDIHFAALFSKKVNAIPIIFLHGYPGSFMEFLPMLEILAREYTLETLPYHVIVPSLPDYGLSGGASENVKMTLDRAARIMNQLMLDLGFGTGYMAQGGDLGSMLVRIMAVQYDACKAFHVNMLVLNLDQKPGSINDLTKREREHMDRSSKWQQTGFAYALEHGTRPSTIGLVISSSPLALLSCFPNFKIPIIDPEAGTVDIHFAALFSKKVNAIPIIFLHGYPGSFMEFLPMLEILAREYTPETLLYHVIVPSLPDYGLSGGASENIKMTLNRAARIINQLMLDLGFGTGYMAQGGDLGSMLVWIMAVQYDACKAFHVNMLVLNLDQKPGSIDDLTKREREHMDRSSKWQQTGFAYALEHGTRPSTIGLVISSSPLALLSWIGEKHLEWSDPRYQIPLDTILAMTSLYWFTSTFPRALYHAELVKNVLAGRPHPISTHKPLGYSLFPYDLVVLPKAWSREIYPNLVAYRTHDAGGHFGALEQPKAFLEDVEEFVEKVKDVFEQ